jgi:hypothetical protein
MSRLIRRIFDCAHQKHTPRVRVARQSRTVAGLKARLMLQPLEDRAVPTVYTVNALTDTGTGTGTTGDLRYCITQANADAASPHTINITSTGTITLTSALPLISKDMTIAGPGAANLTITANNGNYHVFAMATTNFTVNGMKLTGVNFNGATPGNGGGGAIFVGNTENLTLQNTVITGNKCAGSGPAVYFYANGSLNMQNCSITNNSCPSSAGGGVYFWGTASSYNVTNSTIANNTAPFGAGLSFQNFTGTANITNSTITGNSAASGGGIALVPTSNGSGGLSLDNTIVSGNVGASGPDISDADTVSGVNASYSALGTTGGYSLNGSLGNVIGGALNLQPLANVTGPSGTYPVVLLGAGSAAIDVGDATFATLPDQLGNARGGVGSGVDMGAVERIPGPPAASGTGANVTDANASTSNPYSFTVTYTGDVAMNYSTINGNNNAVSVTTPAGVAPVTVTFVSATPTSNAISITATYHFTVAGGWAPLDDGTYTINVNANQVKDTNNTFVPAGAVGTFSVGMTYTGATALVVTNTGDAGTGSGYTGDLRYVLTKSALALGTSAPNQINFSNSTAGGATNFYDGTARTITVNTQLPGIPDNVVITGPGRTLLTVARPISAPAFQMISITGAASQTVSMSGFTESGGFTTNFPSAGGFGMTSQTVTLTNVGLTNNTTTQLGGGLSVIGNGTLTMNNCVVSGNSALACGGLYFTQNTAPTVNINGCTITNNIAGGSGNNFSGAMEIVCSGGSITITNSSITNNTAPLGGGIAMFNGNATLSISNSTLSGNTAGGPYSTTSNSIGGGFLFMQTGTCTISNSTIANNTSKTVGGAICLTAFAATASLTLNNDTITGNAAVGSGTVANANGGGAIRFASGTGTVTLDNTIVSGNTSNPLNTGGQNISTGSTQSVLANYCALGDTTGYALNPSSANNLVGATLNLLPARNASGPNGTFQVVPLGNGSAAIAAGDPAQGGAGHTDQLGNPRPATPNIGALETGVPTGAAAAANVTNPAAPATYTFTVAYSDATAMLASTINGNSAAVTVTPPAGVSPVTVSFVSATPTTNAPTITATYQFTLPAGLSTGADNGTWTINEAAGQVCNTASVPVGAGQLTTFSVAVPKTYTVTTLADSGAGSLRAAVAAANADFPAVDNVVFQSGLAGTITLTSGPINVAGSMNITGPTGNGIVVSGNNAGAVFFVSGTGRTLLFKNLEITGGNSTDKGGAVFVGPNTATFDTVWVHGNTTTSVGGGIAATGNSNIVVKNSAVTGNTAGGSGGGVYDNNFGAATTLLFQNSTISGNSSGNVGGGIGLGSFYGEFGSLSVHNCTITANTAVNAGGGIRVTSSTTTVDVPVNLVSSIVSGNNGPSTSPDIFAFAVNASHSAIGDTTGFTYNDDGTNLPVGTALNLQPLANNGGPTPTWALGTGSPAINVGSNPDALTTDQRGPGYLRESPTGQPDIGAFEVNPAAPPHISTVVVGSGAQRSEVRSITVTFDGPVNFTGGNGNAAAAFQLLHTVYGATTYNTQVANLQAAVSTNGSGQTVVTLTFTTTGNAASEVDPLSVQSTAGGPTTPSLGDGRFTLTILASNVSGPGGALAGNGTTAGTNYVSSSTSGPNGYGDIFRLFGDINGDGLDDLTDLTAFRNTYNSSLASGPYVNALDADNDGVIDLDDLTAFRNHYNHTV